MKILMMTSNWVTVALLIYLKISEKHSSSRKYFVGALLRKVYHHENPIVNLT